jgi:integrase
MQTRNFAIILLMLICGLRRGEVAQATWGDIHRHRSHQYLLVHGKGGKVRKVELPRIVVDALGKWRKYVSSATPERYIFCNLQHRSRSEDGLSRSQIWLKTGLNTT